jgi:hypothetical protein
MESQDSQEKLGADSCSYLFTIPDAMPQEESKKKWSV